MAHPHHAIAPKPHVSSRSSSTTQQKTHRVTQKDTRLVIIASSSLRNKPQVLSQLQRHVADDKWGRASALLARAACYRRARELELAVADCDAVLALCVVRAAHACVCRLFRPPSGERLGARGVCAHSTGPQRQCDATRVGSRRCKHQLRWFPPGVARRARGLWCSTGSAAM